MKDYTRTNISEMLGISIKEKIILIVRLLQPVFLIILCSYEYRLLRVSYLKLIFSLKKSNVIKKINEFD